MNRRNYIENKIHIENNKIYHLLPFLKKYSKKLRLVKKYTCDAPSILINIFLLPLYFILYLGGYRTIAINYTRIGHLSQDLDSFLKFQKISKEKKNIYYCVITTMLQINFY
jgi:hypothetical protein